MMYIVLYPFDTIYLFLFLYRLNIVKLASQKCYVSIDINHLGKDKAIRLRYGKTKDGKMFLVHKFNIEYLEDLALITTDGNEFSYDGDSYFFLLEVLNDEDQFYANAVFQPDGVRLVRCNIVNTSLE